jgi:WD40 repeat protein
MVTGRVVVNGKDKGSGFAVGPHVVLTANHVVRNADASSVVFLVDGGKEVAPERLERDESFDVAVLHFAEEMGADIAVGQAVEGADWRVDARPRPNDPALDGVVNAARRPFKNAQGHETHVVQLLVNQILDEYEGYSGSPVTAGPGVVVGVLVEELRSRLRVTGRPVPATNVLYAISIEDALARFGIAAARAPLPIRSWIPRPPRHLIVRTDELRRTKARLLGTDAVETAGGVRVALVGMGGVGKSVLAAQLARDEDVQQAFPDGVVWVEMDDSPLATRQARLAATLGAAGESFPDWIQGRDRLSVLLADRSCLLVLDNVRAGADLDAFDALGPRCGLLFTTRYSDLARGDAVSEFDIDRLALPQARTLLAEWAGLDESALPDEADSVLEHCGGLALALAMAGAMVRGKPHVWPSLVGKLGSADVAKISARLQGYPYPNLLVALDVSVEDLEAAGDERGLTSARDRYLDLAVFAGRGPIPVGALAALWAPSGVGYDEVSDYVELFIDRSLGGRDSVGRLEVHDLQMADVTSRTRSATRALHARLIEGYARRCGDGWASGPDDGYFFRHLPHHLAEAGRSSEVAELLVDADWLRTKLAAADVAALVADFGIVRDGEALEPVRRALTASARALARDRGQLANQLVGRLSDQRDGRIRRLLDVVAASERRPWLRPLTRSLTGPNDPLRRVLPVPYDPRLHVMSLDGFRELAISADGEIGVCQSLHPNPASATAADGPEPEPDAKILVWSLRSLEEAREIRPPHPTGHLAITGDGRLAVFAAGPWDLDLVDLRTGTVVDQTRTRLNPTAVAIADRPVRIVVGHADGWVTCWDPGRGSSRAVEVFKHQHVSAVAVSPDATTAVALSNYGSLVCLTLPDLTARKLGVDDGAFALAVAPNGRLAATGGHQAALSVWNVEDPDERPRTLPAQRARVQGISLVERDRALTALEDGTIQMWDLSNERLVGQMELEAGIEHFVAARDGSVGLVRRGEQRVLVVDLTALAGGSTSAGAGRPHAVAVSADGSVAYAGSARGVVTRFELSPEPERHVRSHVAATSTSEDGRIAVAGDWQGMITVLDVTREPPAEWLWPWDTGVSRLAASPDGGTVAWASPDRRLTIWHGAGRPVHSVSWRGGAWISSVVVPSTDCVAAAHTDGDVSYGDPELDVWRRWEAPRDPNERVTAAATPDGRSRLLGMGDGALVFEERGGGRVRRPAHEARVEELAITPDGHAAVSGAADGTVAYWEPQGRSGPRVVHGHRGAVAVAAIAPDGRFAVSGSSADELTLWELPGLTRVASFYCDGDIEDAAVAADGRLVVVAESLGDVHLLSLVDVDPPRVPVSA